MSLETTGTIVHIGDIQNISDKFRKRDLVISKSENASNGQTYTEEIIFQITQQSCGIVDKVSVGDEVTVSFNLKGKKWKDTWYNNLDAWKVEQVEGSESSIPSANESILGAKSTTKEDADFFDNSEEAGDELPF